MIYKKLIFSFYNQEVNEEIEEDLFEDINENEEIELEEGFDEFDEERFE